jgi:50S ribosomal subunit-associated GTPase HflX
MSGCNRGGGKKTYRSKRKVGKRKTHKVKRRMAKKKQVKKAKRQSKRKRSKRKRSKTLADILLGMGGGGASFASNSTPPMASGDENDPQAFSTDETFSNF